MDEFIKKLIERLEEIPVENRCSECPHKSKCDAVQEHIISEHTDLCGATIKALAIEIVNQLAEEYNNGWIPCEWELPPQPKENPLYEGKALDIYLVCPSDGDLPFRAFWNGEFFTQGFRRESVIAWQPLPPKYEPKQSRH